MKNTQDQLSQQLQLLLNRLQKVEHKEANLAKSIETRIALCHEQLSAWRQSVVQYGFADQASEIYFFKHAKPRLAGHYRYYQRVLQLHFDEWQGASINQERRLVREMEYVEQVFEQNKALWQYFRSGSTHLDDAWFLRGGDLWLLHSGTGHFDESFNTRCDVQLGELMSMELYSDYIGRRMAGDKDAGRKIEGSINRQREGEGLQCTAPAAHVVVLGTALHQIRFFNRGVVTKNAVMDDFQSNWKVNLRNHHRIVDQVRRQHEPDRFLRDLLNGFNDFLGGKDS